MVADYLLPALFFIIPHTDETEDDNINYARIAFMKDYGLQP
jgi:hypothetical protein